MKAKEISVKFFSSEIRWEEKIRRLKSEGCPKCGAPEEYFIIPPHGSCVISMCQSCRWDILDEDFIPEN
jgi:hypothetical protein